MQSTAAAANSQWVFQTPVDVNLSIYLSIYAGPGPVWEPDQRGAWPSRAAGRCPREVLGLNLAEATQPDGHPATPLYLATTFSLFLIGFTTALIPGPWQS